MANIKKWIYVNQYLQKLDMVHDLLFTDRTFIKKTISVENKKKQNLLYQLLI